MKTEFRRFIATRLRQLRNQNNLEQVDVAFGIRIMLETYKSYELERAEPSVSTLKNICHFYKISIDEFLKNSPNQQVRSEVFSLKN